MRDGLADVLVPVSPKVHAYRITSPWASTVPALLKVQVVYVGQLDVNAARGAVLPAGSTRFTVRVVEANSPQPSVVVSVIV